MSIQENQKDFLKHNLSDIMYLLSNDCIFEGKDENSFIKLKISKSNRDTSSVRMTVTTKSLQGKYKHFEFDLGFDILTDESSSVRDFIEGNCEFDQVSDFYECYELSHWDLDALNDHAMDHWWPVYKSEDDYNMELYDYREDILEHLDRDTSNAFEDIIDKIIYELLRRRSGALRIQNRFRTCALLSRLLNFPNILTTRRMAI